MSFVMNQKRAVYKEVSQVAQNPAYRIELNQAAVLERLDVIYRALITLLYNYVPCSGHPGGSISSGRFVSHLIYNHLWYDFTRPQEDSADIISYAAGHKAPGLYALWALRNECIRQQAPELLPAAEQYQLRLEDLLGLRHNSKQGTPLFTQFHAKPLGGHPEPSVPFVRTSTGASGVGLAGAVGLALAAADTYGENCPQVHIIEGEGGLTAGRVSEALSMAATAQLKNAVFHIDWNQASIESERVTAADNQPGEYVQWTPAELFYMHDCNVITVENGHDFNQIFAAQKLAAQMPNHQPTAIIYRTVKGWKYGLEGKSSHGSGHKFCSEGFYAALAEFEQTFHETFPRFEGEQTPQNIEKFYWDSLLVIRRVLQSDGQIRQFVTARVMQAAQQLAAAKRTVRSTLGNVEKLYTLNPLEPPAELASFEPGKIYTTRGVLGQVLSYLNKTTQGTLLVASADLYASTGAGAVSDGFAPGYFNACSNPASRRISAGGICEDGMSAVCSGVSSFGHHIGVSSSYGAFLAFAHVAARLHAIGVQAAREAGLHPNTLMLFNGHAGLPTGEDGPTHADPQSLQLVQDNFPRGACITATPLEVDEIWPLVAAALAKRPAVFAPFVIRPGAKFMDRSLLGTDPAGAAANGVYYLHRAHAPCGTVFVQGAGIGRIVVEKVLPEILAGNAPELNILYVTSRELFELLPQEEQDRLVPPVCLQTAMGLTDFTLPTLDCWLHSQAGRRHTLYPHKNGRYLGSAVGAKLYEEAGMDAACILRAIRAYADDLKRADTWY